MLSLLATEQTSCIGFSLSKLKHFVETETFCGSGKQNVSIPLHALSGSIQSTLHVVSGITNTLHSALLDYLWVKLILQEIHQRGSSLHCLL
jgi:hypothetical protein